MAFPPTHQHHTESTTYLLIKLCHPLLQIHTRFKFFGWNTFLFILIFLGWNTDAHLKSYKSNKTKTDNIIIIFKCEISIKLAPRVYDFLAHRINIYNVCIGIFFLFFLKLFYNIYYIYSSNKTWAADCLGQLDLRSICAYLSPRGSGLVECCVSILKYFLLISFQLKRYFTYYMAIEEIIYMQFNFNYMNFLMSHVTCLNNLHRQFYNVPPDQFDQLKMRVSNLFRAQLYSKIFGSKSISASDFLFAKRV